MNILKGRKGLSRIEVICIIGICAILVIGAISGVKYYRNCIYKGNDSMRENTAKSVATADMAGNSCIVKDCKSLGESCKHYKEGIGYVGYYDDVSNSIVDYKTKGYNEYSKMDIDGVSYEGEAGTMIIKVTGENGQVKLSWIEGDN